MAARFIHPSITSGPGILMETVLSPAKINLFLAVTGKRPDGYHNLVSLMCPIDLKDRIELDFVGTGIRIFCDHPGVPEDETNLAARAADAFFRRNHFSGGLVIRIRKCIPPAAGLGGGSSNAASVLSALNRYFGQPMSNEELVDTAIGLGSDVPFFLFQRPAVISGKGEKIRFFDGLKAFPLILVCPPIPVSTRIVYQKLILGLTNCEQKLKKNLLNVCNFSVRTGLCNDLETVTLRMHPEIARIKEVLIRNRAMNSLMSGSGPAVFGIYPDEKTAEAAFSTVSAECGVPCHLTRLLAGPRVP